MTEESTAEECERTVNLKHDVEKIQVPKISDIPTGIVHPKISTASL